MNKQTITFTASEQTLTKTGGIEHYASNIVSYIEASFTLGDNWAGYDSIRAVWESGYARIATVLDANNKCIVPAEVLTYKSKVNVNLVGSIVENTVLTDRLTTYPILALTVDADARVDSSETTPVTASQFEQFVDVVRDEASAIQNYTYDSEAWAVGQRAGVDVPSTDETYHNNAKYYADQGATLQQEVTDLKSDINAFSNESRLPIHFAWAHGGIDNATGATNNDGSLTRSRDETYYDVSSLYSITNGSSAVLWLIFYTESGGVYTFDKSVSVVAGNTYIFNGGSYLRIDLRGSFSKAASVTGLWNTSDIVKDVVESKNNINAVSHYLKLPKSILDSDSVYSATALATAKRWFINRAFGKGSVISSVKFAVSQDSTNNKTQYVEIWENTSGTLTKVKSQAIVVTPFKAASGTVKTYEAQFNYIVQNEALVCLLTVTNNAIPYVLDADDKDNVLVSSDAAIGTSSLTYSSLETFPIKLIPSVTIDFIPSAQPRIFSNNVITIGEGMDFEQIQNALLAITDDSASNPYTLLVMPKGTPYEPFTMLRNSFSDSYPWSGIAPRHISIIGLDKEHCVIRSNSGNYKLPCGEPLTNGIIKNLTFVMTNDDQDPNATQGGYCLHIDCKPLNDAGYKMLIEDCDFEDESGPCLGIGVHANCDLQVRRCRFKTTLAANYSPHEGYTNLYNYGVVYCHSSTATTAPYQSFTLEDCVGVCAEGERSLRIDVTSQYDPQTSLFTYTLIRNVFWNKAQNAPSYKISSSLTANPMNFGNNYA